VALRVTKGGCTECLKEDWAKDNEKRKEKPKSEASKAAGRRYYEKNREAVIARAQARPTEEANRYKAKYKEANPDLYKTLVSLRRRRFRDATPKWLSAEQKMEIRLKYRLAIELSRETGIRHAVDHIVPIISDEVCGLHVPWNLRVITQEENLKKSNKLVDTD
jgi:5-methylcytosine-specific restriction endonuclease McrA